MKEVIFVFVFFGEKIKIENVVEFILLFLNLFSASLFPSSSPNPHAGEHESDRDLYADARHRPNYSQGSRGVVARRRRGEYFGSEEERTTKDYESVRRKGDAPTPFEKKSAGKAE